MHPLVSSFFILAIIFTAGWVYAGKIKNVSIVDAMWALSLGIPVMLYTLAFDGSGIRDFLLIAMALTWSLRLGSHLVKRIRSEHPKEDKRYARLRKKFDDKADKIFLYIFLTNALLVFLLSLPFYFSAQMSRSLQLLEWIGLVIFIVGLAGESIADYQLDQFKKNPSEDKICKVGLWNYSRHPNYFFEAVIWLGIYIFCTAAPGGIYTIHAPLIITFLLVKVTGIPPLERDLLESRGDAYRKYQRTTNTFIPGPKK